MNSAFISQMKVDTLMPENASVLIVGVICQKDAESNSEE